VCEGYAHRSGGFLSGSDPVRFLFGYRVSEIKGLDLKTAVKKSFCVTRLRPQLQKRAAISTKLPLWYEGATPPRPDQSHLLSSISGMAKRIAVDTDLTPDGKVCKMSRVTRRKFQRFVVLWLRRNLKPLTQDEMLTFDDWLESTSYSAARREELRGVWNDCGGKPKEKSLRLVKAFIKDETYLEYKFPRGIYSRSDQAKCLFGPLVASVSAKVFDLPWFIKKIPVVDRPKYIYDKLYKPGSEYVFTDYTSFEAHFKADIMESCEHQLFKHMTSKLPKEYSSLAEGMFKIKSGINKIVFKLFTARIEACRQSGEMDTSLSNGFSNLMLYLYASALAGCNEDKISGCVEGDDGLFRNDGPQPTEALFRTLGFNIKIGVTKRLETASFCGQVYDIEDLIVVADVREQVCRLGWTNKYYTRASVKTKLELLRAKGYSLAYQYNGCPILSVLGRKILELTKHITIRQSIIDRMDEWTKKKFLASTQLCDEKKPGISTRQLVEKLYNVSVDDQINFENQICAMDSLGPLPFRFRDLPHHWISYFENYAVSHIDEIPVWLPNQETRLIANLFRVNALKLPQIVILLRGAG
jgi:hypothetical protein